MRLQSEGRQVQPRVAHSAAQAASPSAMGVVPAKCASRAERTMAIFTAFTNPLAARILSMLRSMATGALAGTAAVALAGRPRRLGAGAGSLTGAAVAWATRAAAVAAMRFGSVGSIGTTPFRPRLRGSSAPSGSGGGRRALVGKVLLK